MTRVVEPVIADWQAEYDEALAQQSIWKSRWIRCSGYAVLVKALVVYAGWRVGADLRGWSAEDSGALVRMVGISVAVTVALTLFLAYGAIRTLLARHATADMMAYLLPQAIPIAAPIGLLLGILYGARRSPVSRRVVVADIVVALAVSAMSVVLLDKIIPAANQAFRVAAFRLVASATDVEPSRGPAELTFAELRQNVANAHAAGLTEDYARELAWHYYQRRALAFGALPLAVLALVIGTRRRYGVVMLGAIGVGATAFYYSLMVLSEQLVSVGGAPWLTVWLPHLAVLMVSAVLTRSVAAVIDAQA